MQNGHREHAEALYYHIAGDALEHAQRAAKRKDEFCLAQYVCASMVFSALTLESYINQEYTSHLRTIEINKEHIEVRQKWFMLPLLLGYDKTFKKGETPYQTFDQLIVLCNSLVHFKGGPVSKTLYKKKAFSRIVKDVKTATTYFNCISLMIVTLNELTSSQTSVPDFLSGDRYLASFAVTSPVLYDLIN